MKFRGFGCANLSKQQKEKYKDLFDLGTQCSDLAMQVNSMLPDVEDKQKLPACLLFTRAVAHLQAAILLAESGMTVEAMIIARSIVETSFVLGALAAGGISNNDLMQHDLAPRVKTGNTFLRNNYVSTGSQKDRLTEFISENTGSKEIKIHMFAEKAGAKEMYDGLYRYLSHFAAHPSMSATDPYLVVENGKAYASAQPKLSYTPGALLSACGTFLICFFCLEAIGVKAEATNARGTLLWQTFEALYEQYKPWTKPAE